MDDTNSAPEDDKSINAQPLSADELGRAFAQLMGDDSEAESPPDHTESPLADPDDDETESKLATDDAPVSPESILEAMLFVGHPQNKPLTSRVLASFMRGVSPNELDEMIVELNEQYDEQETAYTISAIGDGYRMSLRDDLASIRNQFYGKVKEAKLSQTAIDVLSIVAYNQPAERQKIESVFGKPVRGILSQLVRRNLLSLENTTERPRKTYYRTTDRFLQFFGLEDIDDLPRGEDF
ncbi:MAG: SMC-Scp complex subunit ScpB [Planctomycetales bacterium]|nr:SMC-Scp complex subunit ScpB [Planctomycetales bacterium]